MNSMDGVKENENKQINSQTWKTMVIKLCVYHLKIRFLRLY